MSRCFSFVSILLLAGCARQAASPKAAAAGEPEPAGTPGARFSQNCEYKRSGDTTMVACHEREVLIILPGHEWQADDSAGVPGGVLFAESAPLRVSVVAADPGESRYSHGEHLTAVYDAAAAAMKEQGFVVGKPHLEEMPNGHLVLACEMTGNVEGLSFRSINTWTALKRMSGNYYDYHVSYTQAAEHADWQDAEGVLRLTKKVADSFFVTDGHKSTAPQ